MDNLVSTQWLAQNIGASDLRIVDASKHLDPSRNARAEYEAGHIPGAVFMDLDSLVDSDAASPNTLPSPEKFASRMQKLGLGDGSRIVVYDDSPLKSAARGWFMLTMFGAQYVAVLDGGLAKWKAEGRELESGTVSLRERHYTAWADDRKLRDKDAVLTNIETGREVLVDARPAARFTGEEPDIRPGIPSGHIPGSRNLPHTALFREDGTWKSPDAIREVFADAGIDLDRPVITSCGSGMTAAVLAFALHQIGKQDVALYDGSWSEWAADSTLPTALGPAD